MKEEGKVLELVKMVEVEMEQDGKEEGEMVEVVGTEAAMAGAEAVSDG